MLRFIAQCLILAALLVAAEEKRDGRVLLTGDSSSSSAAVAVNPEYRSLQIRNCDSIVVPPCANQGNRDIVFLVDASESLDPARFFSQFLDFVQTSWCGFHSADANRGAMITFAREIRTRIPLAKYTANEWFNQVETVRADPTTCCSCCTPTAEAFRAARMLLAANPPLTEDTTRLVMVITDGDPWQNKWNSPFRFPKVKPATYRYRTVPQQSRMLKDLGGQKDSVRILFLGVPNKNGQPPEIDYFTGSSVVGKKVCIKRGRMRECLKVPANAPNYPITSVPVEKYVSVSNSWDVDKLIDLVSDDLCRPVSTTPTVSPTKQPTTSPTEKPGFDHLDLYLFLDRSKSMRWRAPNCRLAPGSNPAASDDRVCWELFLGFAQNMGNKTAHLKPIMKNPTQATKIGWQADFADARKGLRVWIYGFACANQQSTPIVEKIGEKITSYAAFLAALDAARTIIPDGGTCPGAAFERSLGMIMANDLITRPYKAALLFTDGVFYDQPKPEVAAKGFAKFGVLTYALGISIPEKGNNQGLTPSEIKDQKKQLLAFVNGETSRFKNFGAEGYNTLTEIADSFVQQLPIDADAHIPTIQERPWWCGFSSAERCLNTNPEVFDSSRYCKWIPNNWSNFNGNGRCLDKDWCSWGTKATCKADSFCSWSGNKCVFNGW